MAVWQCPQRPWTEDTEWMWSQNRSVLLHTSDSWAVLNCICCLRRGMQYVSCKCHLGLWIEESNYPSQSGYLITLPSCNKFISIHVWSMITVLGIVLVPRNSSQAKYDVLLALGLLIPSTCQDSIDGGADWSASIGSDSLLLVPLNGLMTKAFGWSHETRNRSIHPRLLRSHLLVTHSF
jgi:hypothetical protein